MKKSILLLILIFFIACSSEDSSSNKSSFNPPEWIQGTWKDTDNFDGFKFTNNGFCTIMFGGGSLTLINCFPILPGITVQETTISNTDYVFDITISPTPSSTTIFHYHFKKISATKIQQIDDVFEGIYTKQQ
jgi:hypothetical protein